MKTAGLGLRLPLLCLAACCLWLPPPLEAQGTAEFEVTFEATWSATTHPTDFPSNAHFSGLIGSVHQSTQHFWQEGQPATPGIQAMAETGSKSLLLDEIQAALDAGLAHATVSGGGIGSSPGEVSVSFEATSTHSSLTLVSMVAPSPDWFVGVDALELRPNGNWIDELVIPLFAYDAGTDSGETFKSANQATVPQVPIFSILLAPLGNATPLGSFTVKRTSPLADGLSLNGGRFLAHAHFRTAEGQEGEAQPRNLSDDTGYFWFFNEDNVELVLKVLDACSFNDRFWVFAGGLTNVEVTITVEDTATGAINTYDNPLGTSFPPIQDTDAFATCP